jgi:hypothetical protein
MLRGVELLGDPLFDPRNEILLEVPVGETEDAPAGVAEAVRITRYEDTLVEVEVETTAAGWLFLNDAWYPGWEAELDGEAVEVLRANLAFRAVAVPAGRHTVVFRYRPRSLVAGLWVSALSLLLLLPLALVLAGRGDQQALIDEPPSAGNRRLRLILLTALLLVLLVSLVLRWPLWLASFRGLALPPV